MERHKVSVRVGDAAFDAEGQQDVVNSQYDRFMECLAARASAPAGPSKTQESDVLRQRSEYREVVPPADTDQPNSSPEPKQVGAGSVNVNGDLSRIYLADPKGQSVSLKFLPESQKDSDALLLLLYGFKTLTGHEHVSAIDLIAAARKSGLSLDRVDRTLLALNGFVQKGGKKRGTRYFLTNPGILAAQEQLKKMEASMPA